MFERARCVNTKPRRVFELAVGLCVIWFLFRLFCLLPTFWFHLPSAFHFPHTCISRQLSSSILPFSTVGFVCNNSTKHPEYTYGQSLYSIIHTNSVTLFGLFPTQHAHSNIQSLCHPPLSNDLTSISVKMTIVTRPSPSCLFFVLIHCTWLFMLDWHWVALSTVATSENWQLRSYRRNHVVRYHWLF